MIKRLPSRNQRSKGIKIKHVLQIILLLGVCFWLIYQIKHSHDKKKEFDENDAKASVRMQSAGQIPKLGRKDLHPGKDEINQNQNHEEEEDENVLEDEENKHEHDEQEEEEEGNKHETGEKEDNQHEVRGRGEEENRHGAEEQEEDENKGEEIEDEGRGGGDDEIDENDQEKSELDTDRDEEFMDEEREKEEEGDEKENGNSEDEEKEGLAENQNTHEAREEHYKGDDASSAVAHDTQTTSSESETISLENSDESSEVSMTKESKLNYTEENNRSQNDSDLKVTEGDLTGGISVNATAGKESGNNSLSNSLDDSNSDGQVEASKNLTLVITEASNNSTGTGADTSGFSEQNNTVILSESDHAQNTTVDTTATGDAKNVQTERLEQIGNKVSGENLPDSNSTVSVKTENGDAAAGKLSNLEAGEIEKAARYVASNDIENNSTNSDSKENIDASEDGKSKDNTKMGETNETQNNSGSSDTKWNTNATMDDMSKGDTKTSGTDETSDSSSADGNSDAVQQYAVDSSGSLIHKDVIEVRTDLDTLPEFRNEGENGDEAAAE